MRDANIYLWQVLVPCNFNSGKPVKTRHHREWDKKVRTITGGLTIFSPGKGQWVDPEGVVYQDRVIPVQILASERQIDLIVNITMDHYRQKAVALFRLSSAAQIKYATKEQRDRYNEIESGNPG